MSTTQNVTRLGTSAPTTTSSGTRAPGGIPVPSTTVSKTVSERRSNTGWIIFFIVIIVVAVILIVYFYRRKRKEDGPTTDKDTPSPGVFDTPLFATFSTQVSDTCTDTTNRCGNPQIYNGSTEQLGFIASKSFTGSKPLIFSFAATRFDTCTVTVKNCNNQSSIYFDDRTLGYISATQFKNSAPLYASYSSSREDTCTVTTKSCNGQSSVYPDSSNSLLGYISISQTS